MKFNLFIKRNDVKSLLYRIVLLFFLGIISYNITYIVTGPQYINSHLSNYIGNDGEYLYRNGTLDIGPIYGNVETVLSIAAEGFSETQYISFDRKIGEKLRNFQTLQY